VTGFQTGFSDRGYFRGSLILKKKTKHGNSHCPVNESFSLNQNVLERAQWIYRMNENITCAPGDR